MKLPGTGRAITEAGVLQTLQEAQSALLDAKWWERARAMKHAEALIRQAKHDLAMLYREHTARAPDCVRSVNLEA